MKLAIVILNWNGIHHLKTFLPSVVTHSKGHAIYVIDNASIDDSVAWIQSQFPQVDVIRNDRNEGFCIGYNKGLQYIDAEYYVLLNSDVEVTPGWIEPILELMDHDPSIAAVQPKILSHVARNTFEYAGAAGGHIDYLGYPFCRGRIFETLEYDTGQYNDIAEIFWASGACMFIRADLFHQHGGFDWAFFAHMEEIDLCWRLKNRGFNVYYCGRSTVFHLGGGTLQKSSPLKTFLNYRNGLFLLYKNLQKEELIKILLLRLILDGISGIRHFLKLEFRFVSAILKAHFSFYGHVLMRKVYRTNHTNTKASLVLPVSIVWSYFVKKVRLYHQLPK